jgi:hypothetical protein
MSGRVRGPAARSGEFQFTHDFGGAAIERARPRRRDGEHHRIIFFSAAEGVAQGSVGKQCGQRNCG